VREILEAIGEATASGEQVVVATVIDTIRSAPRQPGAKMAVRESGRFVGSVSGGCVEADVVEHAKQIFAGEGARRVHYGVTDGEAWEVGLSCGGEIDVWLELADPSFWARIGALLDADGYGMLYTDTRAGGKRLEPGVLGQTSLGEDGVFAEVVEGPLRVLIFGAAEAAEHLCAYGRELGWRTTVIDARPALATAERIPSAGELVIAWPDEVADRIDDRTVVVTLSHEERLDIPAVAAALEMRARYIGAIGARRTQERRRAALSAQGFAEADLDRIHGPAGLDLGGRSPAQVALAIAAEIVAVTSGAGDGAGRRATAPAGTAATAAAG
jgi:xanthine dehydrogenase accessory factor